MDPDTALQNILRMISEGPDAPYRDREDLAYQLEALAGWIRKGGFYPKPHDVSAQ